MMSFGWRPMLSCYASHGKVPTSTQQQIETAQAAVSTGTASPAQTSLAQAASAGNVAIAACPSTPGWFYAGLAIAAGLGLMRGKRR